MSCLGIPVDFAVKSFCCHRVDEHIVRGRDEAVSLMVLCEIYRTNTLIYTAEPDCRQAIQQSIKVILFIF
jgi:hypothetical protein